MENICSYFDCSVIKIELNLVILDETPRVQVNTPDPTVTIELPRQCEIILCSQSDAASDDSGVTIAAIILPIIVVITIAAIVVVSVLYLRKRNNNKTLDLEG